MAHLFGLACEGVTDQITIENILCGYFDNPDLGNEITYLQPPLDETDQKLKQPNGGWTRLLAYLVSTRFRDDTLNNGFIVIQVDTDVADKFGVSHFDAKNQELEPEVLIKNVIEKLIQTIESGKAGFYQQNSEKIIFCVSVHSLECWLYAHHNKKQLGKPKITGCFKALSYLLPSIKKTYRCYDALSKDFSDHKHINPMAQKDPSFRFFIQSLAKIGNKVKSNTSN